MTSDSLYSPNEQGICVPANFIAHRDDEYDPGAFEILRDIQRRHFWYAGRHRFLLNALRSQLKTIPRRPDGLKAIDLGGGCGGWVSYLQERMPHAFLELALSDSSLQALRLAEPITGKTVTRYQIDLLDLHWHERWDVAFLLDVLEHIPADEQALRQIWLSLRPGGLLFVTTPAFQSLWSHNDEMAHHVRRYTRKDFSRLGRAVGFENCLSRYFMFFLSPLLVLSRLKQIDISKMSRNQILEHQRRTHRVPSATVNGAMTAVFGAETPLGYWISFPWGTSVLAVFQKPLATGKETHSPTDISLA